MLINTLIYLLKALLPVVILLGLLMSVFHTAIFNRRFVINVIALTFVFSFIVLWQYQAIAMIFNGNGLEFYAMFTLVLVYIFVVGAAFIQSLQYYQSQLFIATLVLFSVLKITEFLHYVINVVPQLQQLDSALLAIVLGLGICTSIGILFFFSVLFMKRYMFRHLPIILLSWFICGLWLSIGQILMQIDWISSSDILWNSAELIAETSVVGYFLTALTGYDAAPTLAQFLCFIGALLVVLVLANIRRGEHATIESSNECN